MSSMMQTSLDDAIKNIIEATNDAMHAQYLVSRMKSAKIESIDELLTQSLIDEMFQEAKETLLVAEGKLNRLIFALRHQKSELNKVK